MSLFPEALAVGNSGKAERMSPEEYDSDPRGILWMWEPPSRGSQYCMGIDPTVGRTGWNRFARVREDSKTDNGAIEVVRVGAHGKPDVQVAEYAAPVDAFELAFIANIIGRLYAGTEDDQCKCIIEIYPGPGGMTLQQMLELGYTNHFRWEYYADMVATPTKSMGWHASPKTNRDLWVKASRHLTLKSAIVRSPWLAEEYADCRMDPIKEYAQNLNGHDDRVRAFNLALWVANSWSTNIERTQEKVRQNVQAADWANSDMGYDDIYAEWNSVLDRMG
jgi:hypothetical protein